MVVTCDGELAERVRSYGNKIGGNVTLGSLRYDQQSRLGELRAAILRVDRPSGGGEHTDAAESPQWRNRKIA